MSLLLYPYHSTYRYHIWFAHLFICFIVQISNLRLAFPHLSHFSDYLTSLLLACRILIQHANKSTSERNEINVEKQDEDFWTDTQWHFHDRIGLMHLSSSRENATRVQVSVKSARSRNISKHCHTKTRKNFFSRLLRHFHSQKWHNIPFTASKA